MKKPFVLSFALAFLTLSSFAQNYQPASLITADGSTLEVELNYKNWKENPETIQFRKNGGAEVISYGVADLRSFEVSGDKYFSSVVEVDERTEDAKYISTNPAIISHPDTVFLRALVVGAKSLYHYYDIVDHFYIQKDGKFELLKYKKYISGKEEQLRVYAYNREFLIQLEQYFEGCQSFKSIERVRYEPNDLKRSFNNYYKCASKSADFVQRKETDKLEISLVAGLSNTTFTFSSDVPNNIMARTDFSSSLNFTGGASFDIVFPRHRGGLSLNNELMYAAFETKGTFRLETTPTRYEEQKFTFKYGFVKMNNMLRTKFFLSNGAALFINGGISNGFVVSKKNVRETLRKFEATEHRSTDDDFFDSRSYDFAILAGVGLRKSRLSVEARVERGKGPLTDNNSSAHIMRYNALLAYRIR